MIPYSERHLLTRRGEVSLTLLKSIHKVGPGRLHCAFKNHASRTTRGAERLLESIPPSL
jgi:hypothetical protein